MIQQDPLATYNPVPVANLTDTITQIHFPTYFSTFTPRNYPDRVILTWPDYMTSLAEILDDTDSDVIEAYLITRAALTLSPYLGTSTEAWQAQRSLFEALSGVKKGAIGDRAETCLTQVEDSLGFASGRFFVNETFGGDSKEKGTKVMTGESFVLTFLLGMVLHRHWLSDIVQSFKDSLKYIDWMDEESATAAAEKVCVAVPSNSVLPDLTSHAGRCHSH